MSIALNKKLTHLEMPPRPRAVFPPLAVLWLLVLALSVPASLATAAKPWDDPIHRYDLGTGLSGLVNAEGVLVFMPQGSKSPLLVTEPVSTIDSRRRRGADRFHAVVAHGVTGGHREFSAQADDDQDGRIDEDPLDRFDNDGDGAIDEDFAAISDGMVAVHLGKPGSDQQGLHLEYYHWTNSRLSSAVFLSARVGQGSSEQGSYRIRSSGPVWREARISSLRHTVTGRPEQDGAVALVCRVGLNQSDLDPDFCAPGETLWLGVAILDPSSSTRFVLDQDQLDLPLGQTAVPLVICAAESRMQLNRLLGEARSVYEGMTDPVDNRRARWIVPPACSICRTATVPAFALQADPTGGLMLAADVVPGQCGLMDPDLFRVGNRPLGIPREIRWLPAKGSATTVPWGCLTDHQLRSNPSASAVSYQDLTGLQGHQAQGRLEFIFDPAEESAVDVGGDDPQAAVEVTGRYLNGRTLNTTLARPTPDLEAAAAIQNDAEPSPDQTTESVEEATRRFAEERAQALNSPKNHPTLSPDLLVGWPNPFNDVINIRFQVPRTLKETFVWKDEESRPTEIDLEADVPWSGGQPNVSVKIYSINGQELVTLHSATQGVGESTVHWNGTDAFGRKVASGTYFCKLQLDDWSVTRRLVFIR